MLQPIQSPALASIDRVAHGFFTRRGGVSEGIYDSLNCGPGSRDDRAAVTENRRRVAAHLGVAATHLVTCHQHHSTDALIVS